MTAGRIRDKIATSKKKGMWIGGTVPIGYDPYPDPNIRSLKVNRREADTVRRLFVLYDELECVNAFSRQAALEALRSKPRTLRDGSVEGGGQFTRGHLYYLLRNPVYIGKIRHKGRLYEGQHQAIVDIDLWSRVQNKLEINAARPRRTRSAQDRSTVETSPLAGKLYDETGDRLTPSHANKDCKRHRYYVSHRLIRTSRDHSDQSGWRLPARQLEQQITALVSEQITILASQHRLMTIPHAAEGLALIDRARSIENRIRERGVEAAAALLNHCTTAPGKLSIALDRVRLAAALSVAPEILSTDALVFSSAFQLRRRGVEAKIVSGIKIAEPERKLIEVLAKAHGWLDCVLRGESIADIAQRDGHAKYYVGSRIQLAFLSPTLQQVILQGTQPPMMTVQKLVQKDLPLDWQEQERTFLTGERPHS